MLKRKVKLCKGPCASMKFIFSKGMCLYCFNTTNNKKALTKLNKPKSSGTKKSILQGLIKTLDDVFSIFIRTRFADENGIVRCFTCPNIDHWKNMDCGHYWSRKHYSTRWDEINCQVQCKSCNIMNQGAGPQFAVNIKNKYGQQALDLLEMKKNNKFKLERFTLETLINKYKNGTSNSKM